MWYGQLLVRKGHVLDVDVVEDVLPARVEICDLQRCFEWSQILLSGYKTHSHLANGVSAPHTMGGYPRWESSSNYPRSVITDLDAREDGVVFVGWRGQTRGLWRVEPGGEAKQIIPNIEPWIILAEGRNIWVATIQHGLWASEEGQPFTQMTAGSITTVERVGDEVWIALSTGEIYNLHTQKSVAKIQAGFASHIAELGSDTALITGVSAVKPIRSKFSKMVS